LRLAEPDLIVEHLGELRAILERQDFHLKPGVHDFEQEHTPIVTVGALIYDGQDQVLLVRTHKWSDLWGIPGGKIKWGEPSEGALAREIKEETNLEIADVKFVMVQDCIHSKEFYRDAHFILLNYTCRCVGSTEVTLNDEAREFRWVTLKEAMELPLNEPTQRLLLSQIN
jgi:ADP-ribose pyrophosphatase YjhB (NUDIX family)